MTGTKLLTGPLIPDRKTLLAEVLYLFQRQMGRHLREARRISRLACLGPLEFGLGQKAVDWEKLFVTLPPIVNALFRNHENSPTASQMHSELVSTFAGAVLRSLRVDIPSALFDNLDPPRTISRPLPIATM